MLHHADTGDLVEAAVTQGPVIANLDVAPLGETGRGDALTRQSGLCIAEGDAERGDAVVLHGVHDEGAPSAADVEQPLTGAESKLATDEIELGALRVVQRVAGAMEVRARVHHALVEPELVEVVSDVVVVADGGSIA